MLRLVFALLLLAMPANAQTEPSLIGAWRLVSFLTADASGEFKPVWEEAAGMIVYTADGHMAAQLYDAKRPKVGPQSYVSPLSKEQPSYQGLYTYFGSFTQDAARHTLMHNVEGAMAPDWIGLKMDRQYRFLSDDRLELKAANDPTGKPAPGASLLVWERAK